LQHVPFELSTEVNMAGSTLDPDNIPMGRRQRKVGEHLTAGRIRTCESTPTGMPTAWSADEAGLGEGLDQAEEARLGETDEERRKKRR
jgi:hypothetical protein